MNVLYPPPVARRLLYLLLKLFPLVPARPGASNTTSVSITPSTSHSSSALIPRSLPSIRGVTAPPPPLSSDRRPACAISNRIRLCPRWNPRTCNQ
ncbi:uncharacterized protein BJ171DRAFT_493291 [Polychytrium aggregatum]|uniref:uncharacterized protein n=1 Tax=Polychytrium aggregatum TaxID=110093 RepID=UPI0022FEB796|nr:uncharacterized protein BJ171DRAFT_493291 [Polychytrium aggregatum]KAI9207640.1 hypothetical protein BJ171DRAFT_493291 [Polychytrium aggregatum]